LVLLGLSVRLVLMVLQDQVAKPDNRAPWVSLVFKDHRAHNQDPRAQLGLKDPKDLSGHLVLMGVRGHKEVADQAVLQGHKDHLDSRVLRELTDNPDRLVLQGTQDHQGSPELRADPVRPARLASVSQAPRDPRDLQDSWARAVHPDVQGHKDPTEDQGPRVRMEQPVEVVLQDSQVHRDLRDL